MPHIDRFLSVLAAHRGSTLRLAADDCAYLDGAGQPRPVTKQPFTEAQLLMLLRESAPVDAWRALERGTPAAWVHTTSDGQFTIRASGAGSRLSVLVSAGVEAAGAAPRTALGTSTEPVPADPAAPMAVGRGPTAGQTGRVEVSSPVASAEGPANDALRERMEALLRTLVERKGSDLHLRVGEPPMIRAGGEIVRIEGLSPLTNGELEGMLDAIMPERNRAEYADLNDTDFAYELPGLARFRCNALRERLGAGAVCRIIPAQVVSVEELGLSADVQKLCYLTKGLVLVTGPTGSGKSTTLCGLVDLVNRVRQDHVITIEDPIEFVHPNKQCLITQRQVGVHTTSFKHALRAALREDPDIILVGELRDLETVSIAIETAETGHLVFGTLHTTTAASTIDRLIDQFPADRQSQIRTMLSESLKGVISQTLCKKIGGGRVAAREILLSIPAVSNLIREGKTFQIPSVMQTSRRLGMVTLNDALIELVDGKLVEPKEAHMRAVDKASFATMLRQRGHDASFAESDAGHGAGGGKQETARQGTRPALAGR